jgi:hypothetical protein
MNQFNLPNPFNQQKAEHSFFSQQTPFAQDHYEMEQQIRHSGVSEEFKIEYTSFDCLPEFLPNTDMMLLFERLKADFESSEWTTQFIAIDTLRCMNKYFSADVNYFFEAFGAYIQNSLFSFKTCIVKNILLFVIEVFHLAKSSSLSISIVKHLIDILIPKAASVSKTIRVCAEQAICELIENCLCDEIIQSLCFSSASKNTTFNEKAFSYVTAVLEKVNENIANLQPATLKTIFQCMAFTLTSKCTKSKASAKQILLYLNQLMGQNNYMNYIKHLYEEDALKIQHADLLAKTVEEKIVCRPSLANELRNRDSTISQRKFNHNVFIEINGRFIA